MLIAQVYRIDGGKMGLNYGLNRVRFTAPVPVGSGGSCGRLPSLLPLSLALRCGPLNRFANPSYR